MHKATTVLAILLSIGSAHAATSATADVAHLSGTLTSKEAPDPSGGNAWGAILQLDKPFVAGGESYSFVQLVLSEEQLANWQDLTGHHARIDCHPARGINWSEPHLKCSGKGLRV